MYFVYTLITTNLFFALFLFWGRTDRYTFFVVELVKKLEEIWNYINKTHTQLLLYTIIGRRKKYIKINAYKLNKIRNR